LEKAQIQGIHFVKSSVRLIRATTPFYSLSRLAAVLRMATGVEIRYSEERWALLSEMRSEAKKMMEALSVFHISSIAYGSIARGDISRTSDIDVFISNPPSPSLMETAIEANRLPILKREIIQATPSYAAKGYIEVGERRSFSFPLVKLRTVEIDFYRFAGAVDLEQVEKGTRVLGIDKRLMLIEPTPWGHVESPVEGREGKIANLLGISVRAVLDRVRTLRRREKVGRTGVFLKRALEPEEGFGEVFQRLSSQKPAIRRRTKT